MKPLLTLVLCTSAFALTPPTNLVATAKGPTQINLTWSWVFDPLAYGFMVEVQSAGDARYASFTQLQPIPPSTGAWACDPSVIINGSGGNPYSCNKSDPGGAHVWNPTVKSVGTWSVEPQYIDPQDNTAAQYIVNGLKPGVSYTFRTRVHSGQPPNTVTYSSYSSTASATTISYTRRYVDPVNGLDGAMHGGTAGDPWQSLAYASGQMDCGQALTVLGGTYTRGDYIRVNKACTNISKLVIALNPGDTMRFPVDSSRISVELRGSYITIDGIASSFVGTWNTNGNYVYEVYADHTALLGIDVGVDTIPGTPYGVRFHATATDSLVAHCYLHDIGSPDTAADGEGGSQNPVGATGFALAMGVRTMVRENHFTRSSHDTGVCLATNGDYLCQYSKYLGNVGDGGWGTGVVGGNGTDSGFMLIEGNTFYYPGYFETTEGGSFKPCIQLSGSGNTVRRNVSYGCQKRQQEISAENSGTAHDNHVYANVYQGDGGAWSIVPLFVSANGGASAYDGLIVTDNIWQNWSCDTFHQVFATEIYEAVGPFRSNSWLVAGGNNTTCNSGRIIGWNTNHSTAGYQYTIGELEANLRDDSLGANSRPMIPGSAGYWYGSAGLQVDAQYVDAAHMDFHLSSGSPLRGAGVHVTDTNYANPSTAAAPDLGAYGLVPPASATGGRSSVSSATRISSRTLR